MAERPGRSDDSGMTVELSAPYDDLDFLSPLSDTRAERLVGFMAPGLRGTVLDLGCGWAELLLRVLAAAPDATGVGVDVDEDAVEHGRGLAERRGLGDRVRLVAGDASGAAPSGADAAICVGASQIWGPPVEAGLPLDYASALAALRALVPRGGRVVYGEGIWSRPPTAAAVAPLGGRLDELVCLGELVELAVLHGFAPVSVQEADRDEWDEFESGYAACFARWLAEHEPDHPDTADVRERAARHRAAYLGGYRGTLGLAYLCLVAV